MALLYFGELYKHYKALNIFVMKVTLNQFYISKYASFRTSIYFYFFVKAGCDAKKN